MITVDKICQILNTADLNQSTITIGGEQVSVLLLDGLVSKNQLEVAIRAVAENFSPALGSSLFDFILSGGFLNYAPKQQHDANDAAQAMIAGNALLVFDSIGCALSLDLRSYTHRGISEPTDENVLKGAKDCFVESMVVNLATIRSRLHAPNLSFEKLTVGKQTKTSIAIAYIRGVTNKGLIDEVRERIQRMQEDGVLSPMVIEEALSTRKFSFFPLAEYTERPDKLCANLLEGRVGIIIDGLPTVYIVPAVLNCFMQAPEDYSFNYLFASGIRLIRYISLLLAVFLPAFYIGITTFHPEMIPTQLAFSIINAKESVPFPSFAEVFFMLFAFELLQEAGLRLPKTIGQAVSIVGGLIIGEAAVSAKLLSPAVIVVVALAGISSFTIAKQDFTQSVRICRIAMAIAAAMAGFVGMSVATIALLIYLCSLESFNVPYLAPYVSAPLSQLFSDTLTRPPLKFLSRRPFIYASQNKTRKKEQE